MAVALAVVAHGSACPSCPGSAVSRRASRSALLRSRVGVPRGRATRSGWRRRRWHRGRRHRQGDRGPGRLPGAGTSATVSAVGSGPRGSAPGSSPAWAPSCDRALAVAVALSVRPVVAAGRCPLDGGRSQTSRVIVVPLRTAAGRAEVGHRVGHVSAGLVTCGAGRRGPCRTARPRPGRPGRRRRPPRAPGGVRAGSRGRSPGVGRRVARQGSRPAAPRARPGRSRRRRTAASGCGPGRAPASPGATGGASCVGGRHRCRGGCRGGCGTAGARTWVGAGGGGGRGARRAGRRAARRRSRGVGEPRGRVLGQRAATTRGQRRRARRRAAAGTSSRRWASAVAIGLSASNGRRPAGTRRAPRRGSRCRWPPWRLALGLLGGEVLRGADHLAGLGQRHRVGRAGDAEVGDLHAGRRG